MGEEEEEEEEEGDKRRENEPIIAKNLRNLIAAGLIVGFDHNRKETAGESRGEISLMLVNRPGDINVVSKFRFLCPDFECPCWQLSLFCDYL